MSENEYDASMFDPTIGRTLAPDPLSITMAQFNAMSPLQRIAITNRGKSLIGIRGPADIGKRIAEYVTSRSLDCLPTKLEVISRRFSPACQQAELKKLGLAPSTFVDYMTENGLLTQLDYPSCRLYFNAALLRELDAARKEYKETKATPEEKAMWLNTLQELLKIMGPELEPHRRAKPPVVVASRASLEPGRNSNKYL